MPLGRSAKKKLRQDKKRERRNLKIKVAVKTAIKNFKKKPSPGLLSKVFSLLDTTTKKKIFHKNKTARLKANLSKIISGNKTSSKSKTSPVSKKSPRKKKIVV